MKEHSLELSRANEIIALHNKITGLLKTSLKNAIRIGELLMEQKGSLNHGKFIPWVKANLPFTDRTARNYMRLHRERDRLKTETVSDLKSAYRLLAEPQPVYSSNFKHEGEEVWLPFEDFGFEETRDFKKWINETINDENWKMDLDSSDSYTRCANKNGDEPDFDDLCDEERLFWLQWDAWIFLFCIDCFFRTDGKDAPAGLIEFYDELHNAA